MIQNSLGKRAQVSLEYLILVTAFFSSLMIIIPSAMFVANEFLNLNDSLLLKQVSETIVEQDSLFSFLANGSRKEFFFTPTKEVVVKVVDKKLFLFNNQKNIEVGLVFSQPFFEKKFDSEFLLILEKQSNKTIISFKEKNEK